MSCQLAPLSCCACSCDPSVIVNLNYTTGAGGGGEYGGDDDPNDIGLIPDDPSAWNTYHQTIAGTQAVMTNWTWNPGYMTWV